MQALVTYFSASGVTRKLAEKLAGALGADLFEIRPEIPYSQADLNWQDPKSRSSVEMKDRNCRPTISERVADMARYDVVFVGFPVWWYREPSIIDTFMEAYDFSGKTVVPFATSGTSQIGESGSNMQALAPGAKVVAGRRFPTGVDAEELKNWAKQYL